MRALEERPPGGANRRRNTVAHMIVRVRGAIVAAIRRRARAGFGERNGGRRCRSGIPSLTHQRLPSQTDLRQGYVVIRIDQISGQQRLKGATHGLTNHQFIVCASSICSLLLEFHRDRLIAPFPPNQTHHHSRRFSEGRRFEFSSSPVSKASPTDQLKEPV